MSIRLRLTLWLTALLAAVLTGLTVLVYVVVADQMENRFDTTLRERSAELKPERIHPKKGGYPDEDDCLPGVETQIATLDTFSDTLFAEQYDACGNLDARSSNLTTALPVPANVLEKVLDGHTKLFDAELADGTEVRIYGRRTSDEPKNAAAIFVAMPLGPLESDLLRLRVLLVAVVLGTTTLAAGIGWFLAAKAMQPVDRMTRAAQAIGGAADLSERVPVPQQHDEIGRLALTFNQMLGRLQQAFATQRQFLADASHELRSPLTAIRANVETVRRGVDTDPADRDETLRIVEREVDRMGRLVDDLLTLARADAGQEPLRERLSLDELLLEVYHQQRALAGRVRLIVGEFEPVEIDGDPDRIKQLLLNLIDNALRHTPVGGTVTLDLTHTDHEARIRVRDTGAGIAPEHLPHIFERFYRIDSARSREAGGTGLGLAISREIAETHGGRIEVESTLGAGTTFTVILPTPKAAPAIVPPATVRPRILPSA
ncbi:MAG: HAMP domain-containing protein [Thermomicrobiales bacterium]|nr:HAMP domain-containing protein [Thermomicrobiales bacterium]